MDNIKFEQRLHTFMELRITKEGTINAMMDMKLISYDIEKQSVTLGFPVYAWQLNPVSHMHGGMICTALDITMGCASYIYSTASFTPTIQMSVNFVKGIKQQDTLIIEGICDHAGSRMVQARGIARIEGQDVVVATANGAYAVNGIADGRN